MVAGAAPDAVGTADGPVGEIGAIEPGAAVVHAPATMAMTKVARREAGPVRSGMTHLHRAGQVGSQLA